MKALALDLYRWSSLPLRLRLAQQQSASHKSRVMVFFYHRVARTADTAFTTPLDVFRRQVDFLRDHYELVTMEEALRRIREGNERPCAHITFDDGYAENCVEALPLLVTNKVPVTYFVSSWHIATGTPFQHDVQLGRLVPVNTVQQLRAMADAGIEIGSHTRRHVDLGTIFDEPTLQDEIVGSKRELEDLLDRPIRYFAFPFGTPKQLTAPALAMAQAAGYETICSAFGGYNFPGDDAFHIQRMHGDNEMPRFCNWATMDPRKIGIRLPLPRTDACPHVA